MMKFYRLCARFTESRCLLGSCAAWSVAGVLVASIGSAYAGSTATRPSGASIQDEAQVARGAQIYGTHCALCHGQHGEGYAADNANALANQDLLISVSDEFLAHSIALGRPGTPMAAHDERYDGPLNDSDIEAVVALIRSWQREPMADFPSDTVSGNPDRGQRVFSDRCAECHGDKGQGISAVSLNNPEYLAVASDGQIRWAIARGRRGTPMVAFEQQLPAPAIDDLVALIRSWQRDAPVRAEAPDLPQVDDVVVNPNGATPQFSLREDRYVSAKQLDAALLSGARLVVLDARPTSDWHLAHIPGALSAPHYDAQSIIERLPRDGTWIVSYCACPHRYSDALTDALRDAGFPNTAVLDEGVKWWQEQGYPVE